VRCAPGRTDPKVSGLRQVSKISYLPIGWRNARESDALGERSARATSIDANFPTLISINDFIPSVSNYHYKKFQRTSLTSGCAYLYGAIGQLKLAQSKMVRTCVHKETDEEGERHAFTKDCC
jgi:hypothetical protein